MKKLGKIQESINRSTIEKWREDTLAFTKNIKRISSLEDYKTVAEAASIFAKNLEKFFQSFIGRNTSAFKISNYKNASEHVKSMIDELNAKSWDLIMYFGSAFRIPYEDKEYGYEYDNWERRYIEFKNKRNSVFSTLIFKQKYAFDLAFKIIDEVSEVEENIIEIYETYKGFKVHIVASESSKDIKDKWQFFKYCIDFATDKISKAGFSESLKNVEVFLDLQKSGLSKNRSFGWSRDATATYIVGEDTIQFNPYTASEYSLVHEIGHRYKMKIMNPKKAKMWDDFIRSNVMYVTEDDLKYYMEKIEKFTLEFKTKFLQDEYENYIVKGKKLELSEFKAFYISELSKFVKTIKDNNSGVNQILDTIPTMHNTKHLLKYNKGEIVERLYQDLDFEFRKNSTNYYQVIPKRIHTSHYGGTNPEEAYAEAFTIYCTGKDQDENKRGDMDNFILEQFILISKGA